ncbi:MAG: hypothetical protein H0X72_01510 [Acidobacteria bacterium]|jgi:hypothetical protein|nr:hypothetical protein [Acidobacteriota bacterium]
MIQTLEAIIDTNGRVILRDEINPKRKYRAVVTILEEEPKVEVSETTLLSEVSPAKDWNMPEEKAWQYLEEFPSC